MHIRQLVAGLLVFVVLALLWWQRPSDGERFRGQLIFGHEARTLQLCGSDRTYWVSAQGEPLAELRRRFDTNAQAPYTPLYGEVVAEVLEQPPGHFARDYDGALELKSIEILTLDMPGDCVPAADNPSARGSGDTSGPARTYVFR